VSPRGFKRSAPWRGENHAKTVVDWSLYSAFPPEEARQLVSKLDICYTPKHGNWFSMAEIEFSALKGQCLSRRISDLTSLKKEILVWKSDHNNKNKTINWQFKTTDARIKLKRLYPLL
jgi:hypothetical protein